MEHALTEACSIAEPSMVGTDITLTKMNESGMLVPITNQNVIDFLQRESANFHIFRESFDTLYNDIYINEATNQVRLTDKEGHILFVNLESYVHNGLMNYFYDKKEW